MTNKNINIYIVVYNQEHQEQKNTKNKKKKDPTIGSSQVLSKDCAIHTNLTNISISQPFVKVTQF